MTTASSAVSGEVRIETSPSESGPQATIAKARQIQRAALAPANPSSQDRQVAMQAAAMEREAQAELQRLDATSKVEGTSAPTTTDAEETAAGGACAHCGGRHDGEDTGVVEVRRVGAAFQVGAAGEARLGLHLDTLA